MRLIWLLVWLSVQWEASQTLHSLHQSACWECWQEWKTAFGGMWACGCIWSVLGCMYVSRDAEMQRGWVSVCVPMADLQECINQSRWSFPTLIRSVSASTFLFFPPSYCPCTFSFFLSPLFLNPPPPLLHLWNRFVWGPRSNLQQGRVLGGGRQILISNWVL